MFYPIDSKFVYNFFCNTNKNWKSLQMSRIFDDFSTAISPMICGDGEDQVDFAIFRNVDFELPKNIHAGSFLL